MAKTDDAVAVQRAFLAHEYSLTIRHLREAADEMERLAVQVGLGWETPASAVDAATTTLVSARWNNYILAMQQRLRQIDALESAAPKMLSL